jgi:hypothetical protein
MMYDGSKAWCMACVMDFNMCSKGGAHLSLEVAHSPREIPSQILDSPKWLQGGSLVVGTFGMRRGLQLAPPPLTLALIQTTGAPHTWHAHPSWDLHPKLYKARHSLPLQVSWCLGRIAIVVNFVILLDCE